MMLQIFHSSFCIRCNTDEHSVFSESHFLKPVVNVFATDIADRNLRGFLYEKRGKAPKFFSPIQVQKGCLYPKYNIKVS